MSDPRVSILLLTRNASRDLEDLLDRLRHQVAPFPFEIVAVDSGSCDGTLEMLGSHVDRLLEIPPEQFNHGGTRNFGVAHCRGELVVLIVQDALPASTDWLEALVAPLIADPHIAGSFARQRARPHASGVTRYYLEGWMGHAEAPRLSQLSNPDELSRLDPMEQLRLCTFDNVCSCIRRSVWNDLPFPETPIAEDVEWARSVLLAGHGLAYAPRSVVIHSHERSAKYELGRTYLVHQRLSRLFGLRNIPSSAHLARAIAISLAAHARAWWRDGRRGQRELRRAVALAVAFPLGQYLGALSVEKGRDYLRPRGI